MAGEIEGHEGVRAEEGRTGPLPWAGRVAREVSVIALFLALSVLFTWPLAKDLSGRTLTGPDPMHHMWSVHWTSGHLLEPQSFFHGNIYHPSPYSVLYIDPDLASVLLVAPLRPFLHDPVPLFNVAVLLTLAFGGWAFHVLLRGLTGNVWAGLLAGVLATFSSHQMAHVYHLNLLCIGWMPIFWLGLERLLRRPGWPSIVLAGVGFALTAQSSGYYAVTSAVVAVTFGAWYWRRLADRRVLVAVLGAVLLAAVLMAPYLHGFWTLRGYAGTTRAVELSEKMAFHPTQDLGSRSFVYRGLVGRRGQQLFPGLLSLGLAAWALRKRKPHAGAYLTLTLALLLFSLGPRLQLGGVSLPLPYRALFSIPPFDSMRHPYTFAAVALFTLSVLAGLGYAALPWARRPWIGALAVLLAVAETLGPGPRVRVVPPGLPAPYEVLRRLPLGPVLDLSPRPHVMVWAARYGGPMVNGSGPFGPVYHLALRRQIRNHWLRSLPEDIDTSKPVALMGTRVPVRYVIVPTGRIPVLWRLAEAFGRSRLFTLVAEADNGDSIFELQREAPPMAAAPEPSQAASAPSNE